MAKLEIQDYDGPSLGPYVRQAKVTLSRRNLLALLHKLDMPGSARRIENNVVNVDGELDENRVWMLVLCCEEDADHYNDPDRLGGYGRPGTMHPETETFIKEKK